MANGFSTVAAGKCLLSCACPFVYLQTATFCKCLVTWLLSLVNPLVYLQFTTIPKCLVTFGAGKWLLRCEDPFMILQITTCFKWLVTIGAGKWLLSCCHLCIFKLLLSVKNYENATMRGTPIQYLIPKAWIVTLLCSLAFCHSGGAPEANRWQHCLST